MGFELNRLMQQYGVATPGRINYSGATPVDPGARPVATDTLTGDALTKAQGDYDNLLAKYNFDKAASPTDTAAYDAYKKEYQTRLQNTPMYMQSQFQTGNEPKSAALQYAQGNMGVKQFNKNIQDWAAQNPNAYSTEINTMADKYGVSPQDIYNATQNRWGNVLQAPKYGTYTPITADNKLNKVDNKETITVGGGKGDIVTPSVTTPIITVDDTPSVYTKPIVSDIKDDEVKPEDIPLIPAPDILETIPSIYTKEIDSSIPDTVDTNIPLIIPSTPLELPEIPKVDKVDTSFWDSANTPDTVGPNRAGGGDLPEEFDKYLVENPVGGASDNVFDTGGYDWYDAGNYYGGGVNGGGDYLGGNDYFGDVSSWGYGDYGGSFGGGGGGGGCPAPWVNILLADGSTVKAGDIQVGMQVYTRHENKDEWGVYPVTAVEMGEDQRWEVILEDGRKFVGTFNHRVHTGSDWVEIRNLNAGDKLVQEQGFGVVRSSLPVDYGPIVKITVGDAHTYMTEGFLSHNIKIQDFASSNFYAKGGPVKTHYQTAGSVSLPSGYDSPENEADWASRWESQRVPVQTSPVDMSSPSPVMLAPTEAEPVKAPLASIATQNAPMAPAAVAPKPAAMPFGGERLAGIQSLLAAYGPKDSSYGEELKAARLASKTESDAFAKLLSDAMKNPEDAQSSKAEMYFRLASAFGAPTKTGHFAENLGMVGKELGDYSKEQRASRQQKLALALKGQEMKMGAAKDDLRTLQALSAEEMKDKRAIATELIKDYIKSGEPQSAAGKQALDEGLKAGTPAYQKRVQEIGNMNVEGKLAQITASLANMNTAAANLALAQEKFQNQKTQQAKLTGPELKLKTETEETLAQTDQALVNLRKAYALNPNTFDTSLVDVTQRKLLEAGGSKDPKVAATREMENLLEKAALSQLKATFPGAISNDERKALQDVQGLGAKSKEERARIMKNGYAALKTVSERHRKRLNEINSGLYRDTAAPSIDEGTE